MQGYCEFISDDVVYSGIALAGGGARATFGSCGAYSAGLMALSVKFCPRSARISIEPADKEIAELEGAKTRFYQFRDWFTQEFGGVNCSDVLYKLFGGRYIQADDESRKALKKLQEQLGFNCQVVTAKTVVKVAEMVGL